MSDWLDRLAMEVRRPPLWTPETGLTRMSHMDLIGGISIRHEGEESSVAYASPMFVLDPTYLMDREFMAARASWLDVRGDADLIVACRTHYYRRYDPDQDGLLGLFIAEVWQDHGGEDWWLYALDDVDHSARQPHAKRVTLGP